MKQDTLATAIHVRLSKPWLKQIKKTAEESKLPVSRYLRIAFETMAETYGLPKLTVRKLKVK